MNKYWFAVIFAGLLETVWVSGLAHSSNVLEWIGTFLAIVVSFVMLIMATKKLPIGTVYAVFTGLGTVGTVLVEIFLFGYPASVAKIILILVLLTGVIGLKLVSGDSSEDDSKKLVGGRS